MQIINGENVSKFSAAFEAMIHLPVILLFTNHPVWRMNDNYVSSTYTSRRPDTFRSRII